MWDCNAGKWHSIRHSHRSIEVQRFVSWTVSISYTLLYVSGFPISFGMLFAKEGRNSMPFCVFKTRCLWVGVFLYYFPIYLLYLWEVLCLLSVHLVAYILCSHVLFFSLQVTHYFSFSFFILFSFLFFRFKIVLIYFNTLVMLIACLGSGKVKLCIVFVWRKVFIAFLCGDVTGKYFTLSSFDDIFSLVI